MKTVAMQGTLHLKRLTLQQTQLTKDLRLICFLGQSSSSLHFMPTTITMYISTEKQLKHSHLGRKIDKTAVETI